MNKFKIYFKDWFITMFFSPTTTADDVKGIFPKAVRIDQDKSFSQLSHGRSR